MVPSGSPYLRRHTDALVGYAGLQPGERVLEVGCGMGRYTLLLAERGIAVEGLDLSPVLLERLRAFDGGRFDVPLHVADVIEPPADLLGRFDAVVGFFTLHHLHDLGVSFRAMARLLDARRPHRVPGAEPIQPALLRPDGDHAGDDLGGRPRACCACVGA